MENNGAVRGGVRMVLRMEGLGVLLLCLVVYERLDLGWGWFAACFLLPDVALLGYLANVRAGALAYNVTHAYTGPLLVGGYALLADLRWAVAAALIWAAHIGVDRALGYGLKYSRGFHWTHLGPVGRR